jgi:PAS domain S-box-containing protein
VLLQDFRRPLLRYGAVLVAVAAAFAITAAIPMLRDRFTFFLFWPLIFIVAWLAGKGPSLLATALSVAAVIYLAPAFSWQVGGAEVALALMLFSVAGAIGAFLASWRRRSDDALRASMRRFESLADSAPVLIWESGPDGLRHYFNQAWLRFTGHTLDQERAQGWIASVHPDDRARFLATYRAAHEAQKPFEIEYRLRRADGAFRTVLARGVPRRDEDDYLGHTGICLDVTDQRNALDEAQIARAEAEEASRSKDAFLATVSHELRTPLSPILTWAHMLREGRLDPAEQQRAIEVIERNARMQAQLVEDLLDVSRIVAGKLRLDVRPVEIAAIVERAIETVRAAADAKAIQLQVMLDTSVISVHGDPDRLQQIIWNLLSNAVKFTPKGGRVHVMLERVNSHVEIAVADSGIGVPSEQLPHLFQRFWQADASPSRAHGGLGLGLAIARHLAELHGGTLVAESPGSGQGSTFTLKLPLPPLVRSAGEAQRRHPALRERTARAPLVRLDGIAVLLVDDERDAVESSRLLLEQCGAITRVATSADEAFQVLDEWTPDVLVSDIGMPGEDGYSLLARLRARDDALAHLPAIALTAFAGVEDRVRLLSAGFQLHLAKPADLAEFIAAVAAVANRPSGPS